MSEKNQESKTEEPRCTGSALNDLLSDFPEQEFSSPAECFEKAMPGMKAKFVELAKDAMDDFYFSYLPHATTDTEANARHIAENTLERILAGNIPGSLSGASCNGNWQEIRQLIFEANKEEIIAAIGKDKDNEIDRLKDTIDRLSRMAR